jgi:intracellular sulfur oxidation DsrE/DsrF family protein
VIKRAATVALLACISVAFALSGAARPAPGGRLSLAAVRSYATGADPQSFAVADLNADRRPDVVTANSDGKSVSVLLDHANGTLAAKHDYRVGGEAESVIVAELNGDPKPDLVVRQGRGFSVLFNRGDGRFVQGQSTDAELSCEHCLASADLNGDHRADVVTIGDDGLVSVFVNRGDGTFMAGRHYVVAGPDVGAVVLADLSGDGRPDIATATEHRVSVLLSKGDGSFGPLRNYKARVCACTGSLAAADLNRDKAIDLVSTEQFEDEMDFASVLLNRGHGTFLRARGYAIGTNVGESAAVADLNGDGAPELIVQYESRVTVFINRRNGTFERRRDYSTPWFFDLTVADVNGGSPDLVFASWDRGRVGVLLNRGHGKFGGLLQYRTLDGPTSVAVADLNRDRSGDVLTLSNATDGGGNRVSVLLNKPGLCNVQDAFRKTLPAARATLARGNCRLGRVTWDHSTVKRRLVMGQRPKFGAVLRRGSAVDVVLSLGQR